MVEVRDDLKAGQFGKGVKQPMTFATFLDRMRSGDESVYLTTQQARLTRRMPNTCLLRRRPVEPHRCAPPAWGRAFAVQVAAAADGHPALYGEPLLRLDKDFVVRPQLVGALVPQQANLWMGCSRPGASSGLHHDFHDNL